MNPRIVFFFLMVSLSLGAVHAQNPLDWLFGGDELEPFDRGTPRGRWRQEYSLAAAERGEGTLGIPGPNRRINGVSATLSRTGHAEFLFRGEEQTYRFAGRWHRGPGNRAIITIDEVYQGSPANGSGTIVLSGDSFTSIEFKGSAAAIGGRFNARFRASNDANDDDRGRFRLDQRLAGDGSIGMSGPNRRLHGVHVVLRPDGEADLTFLGDGSDFTFNGLWSRRSPGSVDLRISRGPDRRPMQATGTLTLQPRDRFGTIELLGRSRSLGGRVRVSFEADAGRAPVDERLPSRPRREVRASGIGEGNYRSSTGAMRVDRSAVVLRPDRSASVVLSGRDSIRFSGTWVPVRDGVARLSITELEGRTRVAGTGTVTYDDDRVNSVRLSGRVGRGSFEADFDAGRRTRPRFNFGRNPE